MSNWAEDVASSRSVVPITVVGAAARRSVRARTRLLECVFDKDEGGLAAPPISKTDIAGLRGSSRPLPAASARARAAHRTSIVALLIGVSCLTSVQANETARPIVGRSQDAQAASTPKPSVPVARSALRDAVTLYPRAHTFWGFESGPQYGFVPLERSGSPDVLVTRVGSFDTKGAPLPMPAALRTLETPAGPAYVLVQLRPEAFAPEAHAGSLERLARIGASIVEYVPNGGYIVKVDPSSYEALRSSPLLQFFEPYHPGFKIAPGLGTAPLPDPDEATSSIYSLVVTGFRGVPSSDNALACVDSDGDGRCEYDTSSDGTPSVGTLDLWLVRQNEGSWDELGSTGLSGPTVTRDTRMIDDGTPICP